MAESCLFFRNNNNVQLIQIYEKIDSFFSLRKNIFFFVSTGTFSKEEDVFSPIKRCWNGNKSFSVFYSPKGKRIAPGSARVRKFWAPLLHLNFKEISYERYIIFFRKNVLFQILNASDYITLTLGRLRA